MDGIQFKLCDIQGRLFELSGAKDTTARPSSKRL